MTDIRGKTEDSDGRRELLGGFLRSRRAQITLEQSGLPPRRGSRSGTLTQEDLARLTGYAVRTISALEQGTEHQPTRELLEALSTALELGSDERHTLWYLATGAAPPGPVALEDTPSPDLARVAGMLEPHMAYVTDSARHIQAANRACATWAFDLEAMPADKRNLGHWIFLDPHARHVFPYWEEEPARAVLGSLRAQLARWPQNRRLQEVAEELCDRSPDARRMWDAYAPVAFHPPSQVTLRVPGHTDPAQHDEERHHVVARVVQLTPTRPDDEHVVTVFFFPDEHVLAYDGTSAQLCAACARERA